MARKIKLETSSVVFGDLAVAAEGKRGKFAKVDKEALRALLRDHSKILALHEGRWEDAE